MSAPPNRMKNVRDLSTKDALSPGYQFEFFCQGCDYTWRSKFKTNRMGQATGWLMRFAFLFGGLGKAGRATGAFSDAGSRGAHDEAFLEAQAQAQRLFHYCPNCRRQYCGDCWDDDAGSCTYCVKKAAEEARGRYMTEDTGGGGGGALRCPNCQTPTEGGRYCAECGFDMASTHKSCPSCGAVLPRASRFCTDCGHGF